MYGYTDAGVPIETKYVTKDYVMDYYPDLIPSMKQPEGFTCGYNQQAGTLGDGTRTNRSTFVTPLGDRSWKILSVDRRSSAGIKTDGTLWTWGENFNGVLGDGTTTPRSSPGTTVGGGTNWNSLSIREYRCSAIKTDGTLWTWGRNERGQLGDGTTTNRSSPVTTAGGGTNWKQVSCGHIHTAAIKTDGTLWTWGHNFDGQLGTGDTTARSSPGTTAGGGTNWKQVSVSYEGLDFSRSFTAAIKTDGTLWTWGNNNGSSFFGSGNLGDGTTTNRSSPGTTAGGGTNWKQVSCGYFMAAIKTDGTLWTWGTGGDQLGAGALTSRSSPGTTVGGGTNWKQVSAGGITCAAIKTDGTLWTWGNNIYGQLGTGNTTGRNSPGTTAGGGTNWKQAYAGTLSTSAISEAEGW